MEKQIEEMARDICHLNVSCDECTMLAKQMGQSKERYCKAMQYARRAYEKGWCKQGRGKWKPYYDYFTRRNTGWICSNCSVVIHDLSNGDTNYCPDCGAIMETEGE